MSESTTATLKCVLCDQDIPTCPVTGWKGGNNAQPLAEGRCCNQCNDLVLAHRMFNHMLLRPHKEETI